MERPEIDEFLKRASGRQIGTTIKLLVEFFKDLRGACSAADINRGDCEIFAIYLNHFFPDGDVTDNEVMGDRKHDWYHAFLYLDGRYYDSEAPDGVTDWRNLPCCARCVKLHRRQDVHYQARMATE